MIPVPVWTVEKPINLLDYLTPFYQVTIEGKYTAAEVRRYAVEVPQAISEAPAFKTAMSEALAAIAMRSSRRVA